MNSAAGADRLPREVYRERASKHGARVAELERAERRFATLRLSIFLAGLAMLWPVGTRQIGGVWLLLPFALFVFVVWLHDRARRRRVRGERSIAFYERGLARLDDDWAGHGSSGDAFLDPEHPYAADLDLFGRGSLFELLCTARTRVGEQTLADWLREPAEPDTVRLRQQAVESLRGRLDLREALAVLGEDVRDDDDPQALRGWAEAPIALPSNWPRAVAVLLALANYAAFAAWVELPYGRFIFLGALAASGLFAMAFRRPVHAALGTVERAERKLELLAEVLALLEHETFDTPLLERLRAQLDTRGDPASRRIARLARLVQLRDSRENLIFKPFAAMMLLGTQLGFAFEHWRRDSGADVRRWLDAVGQFEALSALAAFAYEHPDDPFPRVVESGPQFVAAGIGHPLLPVDRAVRNDVSLSEQPRMLLVSGSNMSGKSTLLRTVGTNAVLALAGGTVRARQLTLSPLRIGACMRVVDSLQDGTSHFYAEIRRLRQVVELGDEAHDLLFLLDEILHGTNSHDRRIGAEALIRGLLERGGIGLVTTHDLELARIADALEPRAINVHFEDRLEGDRITFDYRLKPGVVRKGNALELMRAVGLEV